MDFIGTPFDSLPANRTEFRPVSDLQYAERERYKKQTSGSKWERHIDTVYHFSAEVIRYKYADSYDDQYDGTLADANGFIRLYAVVVNVTGDFREFKININNIQVVVKTGPNFEFTFVNGDKISVDSDNPSTVGGVEAVLDSHGINY